MLEETIDRLRESLYVLITEKADYSKVLKASEILDIYIAEFISKELDTVTNENELSEG